MAIGFSLENFSGLFAPDEVAKALELTPYILIHSDGEITLVNPNPDMGQGSTQAVPALIAEELEVSMDKVRIIQSDGSSKYGVQISGGSGSIRRGWEPLRKAGAAAREMLIKAASRKWQIPIERCHAEDGHVFNSLTGGKLPYGDLVALASTYEIPQNPVLKKHADFKIIGKATQRRDVRDRAKGQAVYGIDVEVSGRVVACLLHSPGIHNRVDSIDDGETRKLPGVLDVIKVERPMPHRTSEAVAVIATDTWSAMEGRKRLKVQWQTQEEEIDSAAYVRRMQEATTEEGLVHSDTGGFDTHFRATPNSLEAIYETPFLAHTPMEPENATVHVKEDGSVEVWAPVQGPDWARNDIAKYLDIIPEKIKIHVTLLGGAFGRKAYHDFLLEACYISSRLHRPVQVVWTREDDVAQGPYRAAMLSHVQGTWAPGRITGFHHHALGESIDGQVNENLEPGKPDKVLCGEIDLENSKYNFDFSKISYSRVETSIPIVWWRSVYASNFSWGQECFIDELAQRAGLDPLEARRKLLTDPRYLHVLDMLEEKAGYGKATEGTAQGIAIWKSFESISAACVTVGRKNGKVRVQRVVSVIDCGTYINPDTVTAQTEGNIIMGLSAATTEAISFTNRRCDQENFDRYRIMRISQAPAMEIHIVENQLPPGGVGEPGLPPIAPALGNAIFNLTGKRIRTMPIDLETL